MHETVYNKFEEIIGKLNIEGTVLEIGAHPDHQPLLASKSLGPSVKKIGLDMDYSGEFEGIKIIKGNSNDMDLFHDDHFDCVICNAVLEHDKYFWKTISEIKRILKKDGVLILGTPSYTDKCLRIHNYPGDYYRFSEQAFKEVFFDGFKGVVIETVMEIPRTIGYGFKE